MTKQNLMEVMKYYLKNFNDEGVVIDDNTVHNTVLSTSDGFGNASSKNIYKALVRWSLRRGKQADKPWPDNWFESSVDSVASKLL